MIVVNSSLIIFNREFANDENIYYDVSLKNAIKFLFISVSENSKKKAFAIFTLKPAVSPRNSL